MRTLHLYSNYHIQHQVSNIRKGDWIYLQNKVSQGMWSTLFKYYKIDVSELDIKYITEEEFFNLNKSDNKFNIVGNPPYNFGLSQHRYIDFVKKAETLKSSYSSYIIPTAWAYSPRFRTFLSFLKDNGLYRVEFLYRSDFPGIMQDVCKIFLQKGYDKTITVISKNKSKHVFSRNSTSLMPASNPLTSRILESVSSHTGLDLYRTTNKTVRFFGDKEFGDYISKTETKDHRIKMLSRLGGSSNNNEVFYVSSAEYDNKTYKVAAPRLASIGRVKYWQVVDPSIALSESLVYLKFDTEHEANNCKLFLESSLAKFLLKEFMQTAVLSKSLLKKIPALDFTKAWTDAEIYNHFSLTQEEIDYIENNV